MATGIPRYLPSPHAVATKPPSYLKRAGVLSPLLFFLWTWCYQKRAQAQDSTFTVLELLCYLKKTNSLLCISAACLIDRKLDIYPPTLLKLLSVPVIFPYPFHLVLHEDLWVEETVLLYIDRVFMTETDRTHSAVSQPPDQRGIKQWKGTNRPPLGCHHALFQHHI